MLSRRDVIRALPGLAIGIASTEGLAQSPYPSRLIKIVVGNAAGGTDDSLSRFLGPKITAELGQPVIVENRGGGSTTIAGSYVASAPADGCTILCLINTGIVQPVLRDNLRYNLQSFTPIIGVGGYPLALAVSAASKITSIEQLKVAARSPEGIRFATAGVGTMAHLNAVRFLKEIQGNGLHVPYKNNPEGLQALAGGYTQMMFASASEVAALRSDGLLRVLAVTSAQRAINLPDVPTMREVGFPSIDTVLFHGFVAPAGTPATVVAKLAEAIAKGVRDPEFQQRFKQQAFQEDIKTGAVLAAHIEAEAARWRQVIVDNHIRITD